MEITEIRHYYGVGTKEITFDTRISLEQATKEIFRYYIKFATDDIKYQGPFETVGRLPCYVITRDEPNLKFIIVTPLDDSFEDVDNKFLIHPLGDSKTLNDLTECLSGFIKWRNKSAVGQ